MPERKNSLQPFPTGVSTLDQLLSRKSDGEFGFAHLPETGFFGVIFGASCSGKSALSLQIAARFVARPGRGPEHRYHAVFLTQEPGELIVERAVRSFGFLDETQIRQISNRPGGGAAAGSPETAEEVPLSALDPREQGKLWVFQMSLEPEKQKSALHDVFTLLNTAFCCNAAKDFGGDDDAKQRLLVCVDNAETICTEAFEPMIGRSPEPLNGQRRPLNFYKRLRNYCRLHRLRAWFTFEEDAVQRHQDEVTRAATAAETYAADAVIRLGSTAQVGEFRERSLEIVKARDQFYRRGRHHITIRGTEDSFRSKEASGALPGDEGVVVFPSVPTQLHKLSREATKVEAGLPLTLGIDGIDEAVQNKNPNHRGGYLAPGTAAVLVADLDAVATQIALHFALSHARAPEDVLYLSFDHTEADLQKIVRQFTSLRGDLLRCVHFPPEHISDSKLLHDIDKALPTARADQPGLVVVDNLLGLGKKFPLLRDPEHFIAAMFQLFRGRGLVALIVDDVEVGEGRNPLDRSFAAGLAQHVFLLRHVEFQTRTRRVFSVLKLAGLAEPGELWELTHKRGRLTADSDRFDFFKGLLAGEPKPVQVAMSLYADTPESPLHLYLRTQQKVLSQFFSQHIEINTYHPDAYLALQHSVSHANIPVLGDCHIISVDEIWLDELVAGQLLVPFKKLEWSETKYVTVAHDLACHRHGQEPTEHVAIPERNNCGVLAIQPALREFVARDAPAIERTLDRLWRESWHLGDAPSWEDLAELQTEFVLAHRAELQSHAGADYRLVEPEAVAGHPARVRRSRRWSAFTFSMENRESCVSFLLEVVLSRLPDNEHLVAEDGTLQWTSGMRARWVEGLTLLLQLLDPWDLHRLAAAWYRPAMGEPRALFSRQWFSSWGVLGLRFAGIGYVELPKGRAGCATPVSGAWYLAMLRQSSAIRAGRRLIERFTHEAEELHRLNYGIGLPVRAQLYEEAIAAGNEAAPLRARQALPYARPFVDQVWVPASQAHDKLSLAQRVAAVSQSKCPFYRCVIRNYSRISPVLIGLLTKAAGRAVAPPSRPWLLDRAEPEMGGLRRELAELVDLAAGECHRLQDER